MRYLNSSKNDMETVEAIVEVEATVVAEVMEADIVVGIVMEVAEIEEIIVVELGTATVEDLGVEEETEGIKT